MTEYTDQVEEQRQIQEVEKWGKGIKYIHTNNGVIETAFNNGDIEDDRKGKITWHKEYQSQESLIDKFHRAMADMKRDYWK